jgi:hypothetical protein
MISEKASIKPERAMSRPRWWPWHQRLGVGFAVVFLVVIFTGIALNHTESLGLDRTAITSEWIYDWYDISLTGEPVAFAVGDSWAVQWAGQLYWNAHRLGDASGLRGAQMSDAQSGMILTDELWVLTSDGGVIERLSSASLPEGTFHRLGKAEVGLPIILETSAGRFATDLDLLSWTPVADEIAVQWSEPRALPAEIRKALLKANRGEDLTLNRIILDLHSGRFFGRLGVWVVDLSALALAFLTITGTWYALRTKRRT